MSTNQLFFMKAIITLVTLLTVQLSYAQSLVGFWEVKEVRVGDELMTPVAKWVKINDDNTFQSGNGWLQNSIGTWQYDPKSKVITPETKNGIEEGFSGFTVSFENDRMIWKRTEEGMEVVVTHIPIKEMPKSPADLVVGLWDLADARENGKSVMKTFDPDGQFYLHIRWDRIYRERSATGSRSTGYWHMHGHKPEITLLSHQQGRAVESWIVDAGDSELTLKGISDTNRNMTLVFKRLDEFPK